MPATSWPIGAFARYLTVSGGTVDVTRGNSAAAEVSCLGCPDRETVDRYGETADDATVQNERVARAFAEAHADRCRSIARPETGA